MQPHYYLCRWYPGHKTDPQSHMCSFKRRADSTTRSQTGWHALKDTVPFYFQYQKWTDVETGLWVANTEKNITITVTVINYAPCFKKKKTVWKKTGYDARWCKLLFVVVDAFQLEMWKYFHMIKKRSEWFKLTEETALSQISTLYKHGKQKSISEHMNMSNLGVEVLQRQKTSPGFNSCPPRAGIGGYRRHDHSKQADKNLETVMFFFKKCSKDFQFPILILFFLVYLLQNSWWMYTETQFVQKRTSLIINSETAWGRTLRKSNSYHILLTKSVYVKVV